VKRLLQPKVLIPMILSLALLGALLAASDLKKVVELMSNFRRSYLAFLLLLMGVYEVVRGIQWHFLLHALELKVPLRGQIFAFALGEITKSLPIGNYFQNYVLKEAEGSDFGRSAAASTMIVLTEVAVSLLGVVVLGLGSWTGWLRPVILIGVLVAGLIITLVYRLYHAAGAPPHWMKGSKRLCGLLEGLRTFSEGTRDLLHPRVLAVQALFGSVYLVVAGSALFLVARGLDVTSLSYTGALAVYFFSLAVSLIFPLPIDIGVAEVSGAGALVTLGIDRNAAISIMLVNRVLNLGASIAIATVTALVLRDEFALAFGHGRRSDDAEQTRESVRPNGPWRPKDAGNDG
jgi:uncharacterized protein (TIRG00374 family)